MVTWMLFVSTDVLKEARVHMQSVQFTIWSFSCILMSLPILSVVISWTSDIYLFLFIRRVVKCYCEVFMSISVFMYYHVSISGFMYSESFDTMCQFRDLCIMGSFR
jgi:hypothetical protein